jgi:hypothetical protein
MLDSDGSVHESSGDFLDFSILHLFALSVGANCSCVDLCLMLASLQAEFLKVCETGDLERVKQL